MKLIGIEEHFLTADIRAAWVASVIGEEGSRLSRPAKFTVQK